MGGRGSTLKLRESNRRFSRRYEDFRKASQQRVEENLRPVEVNMTRQEALKRLGLNETETISEAGVRLMIDTVKNQLSEWSLPDYRVEELRKEWEAYEALLKK